MFCPMCGAPNEDDADFCGNCGAAMNAEDASSKKDVSAEMPQESGPVEEAVDEPLEEGAVKEVAETVSAEPVPPSTAAPPFVPTSGLAIASLVSGVTGLTILPFVGGILAIVLGYMARRDIRDRPDEVSGDGLALAGIILGWIAIGLIIVGCLVFGAVAACGMVGSLNYSP